MQTERTYPPLARIDFPGGHNSARVRPMITPDIKPHYDSLREGMLVLPECDPCKHVGPPAGACCLWCGAAKRRWRLCSGHGTVHSWVRYRRGYLPEFEALVPYAVIAGRLDEGPVMFGRWISPSDPTINAPIQAVVEQWADGFCGLAFQERVP